MRQLVQVIFMPALHPDIEQKVKDFWADWKAKNPGISVSRRALHRHYRQRVSNNDIGLSKFNQVIRVAEGGGPPDPFPREEWDPWVDPQETAEDTAFLLRLNAVCMAEEARNLIKKEAEWARRLRASLAGLHPYGQYRVVEMYVLREARAHYRQKERYTADLDGILAYQPWVPQNRSTYDLAVASGNVPYPFLDPTEPPSPIASLFKFSMPDPMWGNTPEARERFMNSYDERFGLGASVESRLAPPEFQFVKGEDGQLTTRQGLSKVPYGEDDGLKGAMLNLVLKFWADTGSDDSVDGESQENKTRKEADNG